MAIDNLMTHVDRASMRGISRLLLVMLVGGCGDGSEVPPATPDPPGAGFVPANSNEDIAQRLSIFLWDQSRPEVSTVDLVAQGKVRQAVEEMVADMRVVGGLSAFMTSWLDLAKLEHLERPGGVLTPALRKSMRAEVAVLASHNFIFGEGSLGKLLTSDYTFMDDGLAALYGLPGPGPAAGMVKTPFGTTERAGIFGTVAVMTVAADENPWPWPTRRFRYLADKLFCSTVGAGPFVMMKFPADPNRSMRRQLLELTTRETCKGCHAYVNPVGFAFLKFDSLGRLQQRDLEGDIDSSGTVPVALPTEPGIPSDLAGLAFAGEADLMHQLAENLAVRKCLPRHWLAHARGKDFKDRSLEGPALDDLVTSFMLSDGDMHALMTEIALQLAR